MCVIGWALSKFSRKQGMQVDGGVAYGMLKGCFVSLSEGAGYKRMCIYVGCHHRSEDEQPLPEGETPEYLQAANAVADTILEKAADFKAYRIMTSRHPLPGVVIVQGGSVVQVNFYDNPGTMKCIEAFVEQILPQVAAYTDAQACACCGAANDTASRGVLLSGEAVVPMHQACAETLVESAAAREADDGGDAGRTFLGILGACIGALLGALVWALIGIFGYVASVAGFVAAFLAGKGYDLLGGKPGKIKLVTLVLCVVLAVIVGNAACEIYWLHELYQEEVAKLSAWEVAVPEAEFLARAIPLLWEEPEITSEFVKGVLIGLFFAALGCWTVLRDAGGKAGRKIRMLKGSCPGV